jgi:hypothetical protein
MDQPKAECRKDIFNSLSKADQLKLKGSTLSMAITDIVQKDTKRSPWKFPFYAAYLMFIATPLPFFGAGGAIMAATVLYISKSKGPWAKWANNELKQAFNECAMIDSHKDHVIIDKNKGSGFKIKSDAGLFVYTSKRSLANAGQAAKNAISAIGRKLH